MSRASIVSFAPANCVKGGGRKLPRFEFMSCPLPATDIQFLPPAVTSSFPSGDAGCLCLVPSSAKNSQKGTTKRKAMAVAARVLKGGKYDGSRRSRGPIETRVPGVARQAAKQSRDDPVPPASSSPHMACLSPSPIRARTRRGPERWSHLPSAPKQLSTRATYVPSLAVSSSFPPPLPPTTRRQKLPSILLFFLLLTGQPSSTPLRVLSSHYHPLLPDSVEISVCSIYGVVLPFNFQCAASQVARPVLN